MVRARSLVASWNPARCEPMLALLRERQLWPVLVRDSGEIASAVKETDVALIVLNGPCEFCRPFFQMLGQARSTLAAVPPLATVNDLMTAINADAVVGVKASLGRSDGKG